MTERNKVVLAVAIILVSLGIVGGALLFATHVSLPPGRLMHRETAQGPCDLQWSPERLPILIHLPQEAGLDWRVAALAAAAQWNDLAGLELVALTPVESAADVQGIWHNTSDYKANDEVFKYQRTATGQCFIEQAEWHFPGLLAPEARKRWLMHGMGHFLGLEHDGISRSVMNGAPRFFTETFEVPAEYPALLRRIYVQGGAP